MRVPVLGEDMDFSPGLGTGLRDSVVVLAVGLVDSSVVLDGPWDVDVRTDFIWSY